LVDGYEPTFASVRINPNVWLGFHVTVLPGVSIGANTIVAAGAVASRDLPANVLAGGVPAKPIKPLGARRLEDAEVWELLEDLLGTWCEELRWKGVACERISPLEVRAGGTRVVGLPDDTNAPPAAGEEEMVLLTLSARSDLHTPVLGRVVFDLRDGGLVGSPFPVTHDLRDFLRRNALPCGDNMKFSSLQPEPFARLTNPGRSAVRT
jgi:hypothetical protein